MYHLARLRIALTCTGLHAPPRGVRIPRAANALATPRNDLMPLLLISRITGNTFAEYRSALSFLAKAACRRASESFGLPRRLPRALAALRAADVRALIISRSCWATAAKMWMVPRLSLLALNTSRHGFHWPNFLPFGGSISVLLDDDTRRDELGEAKSRRALAMVSGRRPTRSRRRPSLGAGIRLARAASRYSPPHRSWLTRALLFEAGEDRPDCASALDRLINISNQGPKFHGLFGQSGDDCIACGDVNRPRAS
jgi:hypothetical protein